MTQTLTLESLWNDLARRYQSGSLRHEHNCLRGSVAPPEAQDIVPLPLPGDPEYERLCALGRRALEQGELGAVILSGGMATRFNYDRPKGLYPILDKQSFLELKVRWIRQLSPTMPIFIMTSFHTDAEVRRHFEENDFFGSDPSTIHFFEQFKFRRLNPDGSPFHSPDGSEDFAAPGHGDFPFALKTSGLLDRFLTGGGRYLLFSNVDNLGASVDLAIVGMHIDRALEMTVEVAAKAPGDKGGAPARVDGRVQLVEGFCFPEGFDQDMIPVFNTASYVFNAQALTRELDLPWYVVDKKVDGQPVIQFERLAGDISMFLKTGYVEVNRDRRFIPVKNQEDVPAAQEKIRRKAQELGC